MDEKLSLLERLENLWFARLFVDGWHEWLLAHPKTRGATPRGETKAQRLSEFITPNAYACLKLNSENFLLFLHWLQLLPDDLRRSLAIAPWLFGSQQNEQFFRALRSYQNRGATFNFLDGLNRASALQLYVQVRARNNEAIFIRPHDKHKTVDSLHRPALPFTPFTEADLHCTLTAAHGRACDRLLELGIDVVLAPAVENELDEEEVDDEELMDIGNGFWESSGDDSLQVKESFITFIPIFSQATGRSKR